MVYPKRVRTANFLRGHGAVRSSALSSTNLPGDLGQKEGHFNGGGIPHRHHGLPSRRQPSRRRLARGWCPYQQQLGHLQSSSWKIGNDTYNSEFLRKKFVDNKIQTVKKMFFPTKT
ncbi:hypothetical protein SDJN03_28496, partial [Cucurbita argyrosperma subsp. sororia]